MNNVNLLLGYNPHCSIYPKKRPTGTKYYISYYLPNGKRMMRLCHEKKSEAKRLMYMKQQELLQGKFDVQDQAKMPEISIGPAKADRLRLEDAMSLYFVL